MENLDSRSSEIAGSLLVFYVLADLVRQHVLQQEGLSYSGIFCNEFIGRLFSWALSRLPILKASYMKTTRS